MSTEYLSFNNTPATVISWLSILSSVSMDVCKLVEWRFPKKKVSPFPKLRSLIYVEAVGWLGRNQRKAQSDNVVNVYVQCGMGTIRGCSSGTAKSSRTRH